MKIWMTSLVISERQTETSMSYHFTHIEMIRVKKSDKFCGGCEDPPKILKNMCLHKNLYTNVNSSIIHNSQTAEAI